MVWFIHALTAPIHRAHQDRLLTDAQLTFTVLFMATSWPLVSKRLLKLWKTPTSPADVEGDFCTNEITKLMLTR
jgi:hypothetical protein